ncbi:MAG: tRNA guanosine(34) transglycosylase Tgt [Phycisphaerales bacterium]
MASPLHFEVCGRSPGSWARVGRVHTAHGAFDTPAFMPVGTRGTVKGLLPDLVRRTGSQVVLNNTYHLLLRPGPEVVAALGGVHRFMGWAGPILTDSGGYQTYSMADLNAVDDDGVTFRSIVDGSELRLTPERATQVQNQLGADIIMAFDDCPPSETARERDSESGEGREGDPRMARAIQRDRRNGYDHAARLRMANERTVRWLERCRRAHQHPGEQALFGIIQGGTDLGARSWSAERITAIELPGYAIGGVAVGEPPEEIARIVRHTAPLLPEDRPRYLMGVGYERDIVAAVLAGVDMFDCVLPTRNGRNASAFTPAGQIRLKNACYTSDPLPIEPGCDCLACLPAENGWETPEAAPISRGYLRHLFQSGEMLGPILVSLHNVRYFQRLMSDIRRTIVEDDWPGFARRWPQAAPGLAGSGIPAQA